jgi:hypothetical protein
MATEKQIQLIVGYINKERFFNESFKQILNAVPFNELADRLKPLTSKQADYIIKAYIVGDTKYSRMKARNILGGLKLI